MGYQKVTTIRKRLRIAWHVLKGYPLAYNLRLTESLPLDLDETRNLWIVDVVVKDHQSTSLERSLMENAEVWAELSSS